MRSRRTVLALVLGMQGLGSGCAPAPAHHAVTLARARPAEPAHARDRTVMLHVTNGQPSAARIFVIRAGRAAAPLGTVQPMSSALFDVTHVAPVGSRVRFAALVEGDLQHAFTPVVQILRSGTVLIEIEPRREGVRHVQASPLRSVFPPSRGQSRADVLRAARQVRLHGLQRHPEP